MLYHAEAESPHRVPPLLLWRRGKGEEAAARKITPKPSCIDPCYLRSCALQDAKRDSTMKIQNRANSFQKLAAGTLWVIAASCVLFGAGCSSTHEKASNERAASAPPPNPLRVGITPDYPPLVF